MRIQIKRRDGSVVPWEEATPAEKRLVNMRSKKIGAKLKRLIDREKKQ